MKDQKLVVLNGKIYQAVNVDGVFVIQGEAVASATKEQPKAVKVEKAAKQSKQKKPAKNRRMGGEEKWDNFSKNIDRIRKEPGLSTPKLAKLSGISDSQISRIANGARPHIETAIKIADGLGMSLNDLLSSNDEQKQEQVKAAKPAKAAKKSKTANKQRTRDAGKWEDFSKNIRRLRKELNFTLKDMADLTGVSPATLGKIESGYIASINTVIKIADGLDMSLNDLFKTVNNNGAAA